MICVYLPKIESVGINIFEHMLLLLLDEVLEGTNVLIICNFDCESVAWTVAKHNTVEFEVKGV